MNCPHRRGFHPNRERPTINTGSGIYNVLDDKYREGQEGIQGMQMGGVFFLTLCCQRIPLEQSEVKAETEENRVGAIQMSERERLGSKNSTCEGPEAGV